MNNIFKRILNFVEDTFLKNHSCICCYKEIDDNTKYMICDDCKKSLEKIDGHLCEKCGDKLNIAGKCINSCADNKYYFDKNFSLFYYEGTASKIVKNLKYGNKRYIASFVGNILTDEFKIFDSIDYICFVPMTKKRRRERGFNQAEEIAKVLSEKTGVALIDLLVKSKETKHQAGGTQKERLKNLQGTFEVNENYKDLIKNKNILIIDDVFTTGATLSECAKTIKKFRPKKIYTMTFAKTKFDKNCLNIL